MSCSPVSRAQPALRLARHRQPNPSVGESYTDRRQEDGGSHTASGKLSASSGHADPRARKAKARCRERGSASKPLYQVLSGRQGKRPLPGRRHDLPRVVSCSAGRRHRAPGAGLAHTVASAPDLPKLRQRAVFRRAVGGLRFDERAGMIDRSRGRPPTGSRMMLAAFQGGC